MRPWCLGITEYLATWSFARQSGASLADRLAAWTSFDLEGQKCRLRDAVTHTPLDFFLK